MLLGKHKRIILLISMIFVFVVVLSACGRKEQTDKGNSNKEDKDTGFILTGPESYDSIDTALITKIDRDKSTITFFNYDVRKKYTLEYDGTTHFSDKYGETISLGQLENGMLVDVSFLKAKKHLTSLNISKEAWTNKEISNYTIDNIKDEITIGSDIFKMDKDIFYFSDNREISDMDVNEADILSFVGTGTDILSVKIEKGHGYLRLKNDAAFIGGFIEIGQSIIQKITEDMLLTVPEGSYDVNISYKGNGGIKSVVINRNEETTLDIGDLKIAETKYGNVIFTVTPDNASVYIDGEKVDTSAPVSLSYGLHQLICRAEGYLSITKYLNVGQESAGIDIILDEDDETDEEKKNNSSNESSSEVTVSKGDASNSNQSEGQSTVTDYYKIYVDAPKDVEVYLDGNYVGVTPCSFKKVTGAHEITLRKTGYETRSYSISVDDEKRDFSYSFADLISNN